MRVFHPSSCTQEQEPPTFREATADPRPPSFLTFGHEGTRTCAFWRTRHTSYAQWGGFHITVEVFFMGFFFSKNLYFLWDLFMEFSKKNLYFYGIFLWNFAKINLYLIFARFSLEFWFFYGFLTRFWTKSIYFYGILKKTSLFLCDYFQSDIFIFLCDMGLPKILYYFP